VDRYSSPPCPRRLLSRAAASILLASVSAATSLPGVTSLPQAAAATDTARDCAVGRGGGEIIGAVRGRRIARDRDRDRLRDPAERSRFKTRPFSRDTDRDRLTDGFEVYCSRSSPRMRDSDGDGEHDGMETVDGSDPNTRDVFTVGPEGGDGAEGTARDPWETIDHALDVVPDGSEIRVLPGTYPAITDDRSRDRSVTVTGFGGLPTIAGADLHGSSRLVLRDLRFTAPIDIAAHPTLGDERPANDITVLNSEIVSPHSAAIRIGEGSREVNILGNWVHDSQGGIAGAQPPRSRGITIVRNTIERVRADGIQFGYWDDVSISENTIRETIDPADEIHNDGIQFRGPSEDVRITRNRIHASGGQLMLVQPSLGPIDDVLVENNLMFDSEATGVQSQAATNVRFVHNTIWNTGLGSLTLSATSSGAVASDTVVVGNILEEFGVARDAGTAYRDHNLFGRRAPTLSTHELLLADPGFLAPDAGDYRPGLGSPALGAGNSAYAPRVDLAGRLRRSPPTLGALE
jgi:hypothetical protein